MKYMVKLTAQFKRDYKRMMKQRRDISLLDDAIRMLASGCRRRTGITRSRGNGAGIASATFSRTGS